MNLTATVDLFEEIKARLGITEVVEAYGVHIKRDKALCPFHNEKSPSFTVYPSTNTWYCFGCGVGGSVIDFAAEYLSLEPLEAAKQLDNDFNLGLADQELTPEQRAITETRREKREREKREREKRILSDYEEWEDAYFIFLCDSVLEMDRIIETSKPFSDKWCFAHNRKLTLLYHQEIIMSDDVEARAGLYNEIMCEGGE